MIEEIIKLKGIGMLHDSVPGGLTLSQAVAIYAENGRGKSTFSHLLRSLSDNDCTEVTARRALRQEEEPTAELLIDGVKYTLSDGAWDQTWQGQYVFDDRFVSEYVGVGDVIAVENLERLLAFALGQQADQTADQVEESLEEFCDGVNSRLRSFLSDVEISSLERDETTDPPRAVLTLRLMGHELPLETADPRSPDLPAMLGPGARRLLALALFFYALDSDPDLPGKTIVFDDPARGLDRHRKTRLAESIMGFAGRGQVIVLSPDAEFIRMMRERGFDQVLELRRSGVYCVFAPCDIDEILAADYSDRFVEPEGFMAGGHPF